MTFENVEHFAILLGVFGTAFGLAKGISGWRKSRDEAMVARAKQLEQIEIIAKEFKPRNGRTLAQVVADIDASVNEYHAKVDKWVAENTESHKEIHRRIDGLFELTVGRGATQPRKISEFHAAQRSKEEE